MSIWADQFNGKTTKLSSCHIEPIQRITLFMLLFTLSYTFKYRLICQTFFFMRVYLISRSIHFQKCLGNENLAYFLNLCSVIKQIPKQGCRLRNYANFNMNIKFRNIPTAKNCNPEPRPKLYFFMS